METDIDNIDKKDIDILYYLITNNRIDSLYSAKITDIYNYFKIPISYYTISRRIKKLIEKEYIKKGYRVSNADTYYLSQKAIDFMNENVLNRESVHKKVINNNIESGEVK